MKNKIDKKNTMKAFMMVVIPFINATEAEHCILSVGGNPSEMVTEEKYAIVLKAMEYCYTLVNDLLKNGQNAKGYLYYTILKPHTPPIASIELPSKPAPEEEKIPAKPDHPNLPTTAENEESIKIYEEVEPYELKQVKIREKEEIKSFDDALDIYFTAKEKEKDQTRRITKEAEIWKKMEKIKNDQESRIKALQQGQDLLERKAKLIEQHVDEIDSIIKIINTMVMSGVKWADIWKNIKDEKKRGNVFANLIHSIDLINDKITVMLNQKEENNEENGEAPAELVEIDISKTAYQNYEKYYLEKKNSAIKELKTKDAAQIAIKTAEKVAQKELRVEKQKIEKLQKLRKVFWFEKFNWFITSENYLVLSGRTAQENEILVKRYLRKGDLFVHASIHGAAATIIKNPSGNPVSPISLNEAGLYCVCRSSAWEQKLVTGAFWVYHYQVSKTAPSGEYLSTGSFMIRGKKNYLYPTKLEMGFTYLFYLDESCIPNHINDRKIRVAEASEILPTEPPKPESEIEKEAENIAKEQQAKLEEKQKKKLKQQQKQAEKLKEKQDHPPEKAEKVEKAEKLIKTDEIPEKPEKTKKTKISKAKQKKIKKMKEKYGDMDDEDRELMLKLIGVFFS